MTIIAAADGSALGNPGPAGWSWYVDEETWAAGGWKKSTNNRGELMAVAELLAATSHRADEELNILCDSQYVINSVTKWMPGWKKKGWKKRDGKPVLNVDILTVIDELMQGRNVRFEWIKGHAGHEMNEAADSRARAAATAFQRSVPVNEGPGFPGARRKAADSMDQPAESPTRKAANAPADPQGGLFDVTADPVAELVSKVRAAHATLARAASRSRNGDDSRLAFLVKRAVVIPADRDVALPEDFATANPEVTVVGSTAVAVARGNGWTTTSTWNVTDDVVLVALHHSANA